LVRFCANVTLLFREVPLIERFGLARKAGFDAVEIQVPYEIPADEIAAELERHNLDLVLFNTPSGNMAAGDRGLANDPLRQEEFEQALDLAFSYARVMKPQKINCTAGRMLTHVSATEQRDHLKKNLAMAADRAAAIGVQLMIEPLNPYDAPGFAIPRPSLGFELVSEIGQPNLKVEYDIYHAQRTEGQIVSTIRTNLEMIGHIQIADAPGRNEPGTGELNWSYIFAEIDAAGYDGRIGVEYNPSTADTVDSLGWMEAFR
jgi:hydroxypyruvate isomerase